MILLVKWPLAAAFLSTASCLIPPPPAPEPINVIELPLPPVCADNSTGACNYKLNPRRTGCITQVGGGSTPETVGIMASGDFLLDSKHVISMVTFVGAPPSPDPASIYDGEQIIIVKTDGQKFPNGDPWKCITCGIPFEHRVGMSQMLDYPQAFDDGKRILAGDNIIDCGNHLLASQGCKPEHTYIYPIRWETTVPGSSANDTAGGAMRELRIHPDTVHIGFSSFTTTVGKLGQFAFFGRLVFNPNPAAGLPRVPRYDVRNVTVLFKSDAVASVSVEGEQIFLNHESISVGELRGFSGRGHKAIYIGNSRESSNVDALAVHLQSGKIDRITSHPEYVDPIDVSADDEWSVILDTRATARHMFLAAMAGVPPLIDMVASSAITGVRKNGPRRFFQPWIIDKYGDRDNYYGQKVNGDNNGTPGSYDIDDPEWNAMADPRWSPDGTAIAYWQAQTIAPACGASDVIPWGTPYVPGQTIKPRSEIPAGEYVLKSTTSGSVNVTLIQGKKPNPFTQVVANYHNYSTDGIFFINGWENVTRESISQIESRTHWYSDLIRTSSSGYLATKKSSSDGWHLQLNILKNFLQSNGTLATTINGVEYLPPQSGT